MKILYIEDNPIDIDLTLRRLEKEAPDMDMDIARSQTEALKKLNAPNSSEYDLVLSDMHLQDGNGIAILSHIRALSLPVAVIILTGQGDEQSAVAALKAGADDYVVKKKGYLEKLPHLFKTALMSYCDTRDKMIQTLKVLYVEHNKADVDLTRRHFEKNAPHIHMEAICNVMEFYKHLANAYYLNKYDVLLLDYRIPQENALEILNKIRISSYSDIPVILVTGKGDEEIAVNALKSGAFDYITKSQGYLFKLPSVIENAHYSSQLARKHEALLESENRYRSLFEKNHVAMLLIDPVNGDIIDANSAAVLFYGWSKAQLISKKIFAVNTCNPEKTEAELQDVANEINTHFFLKHRRADDSICDVEVYRGAIVIMGRSLVYSMVYDISERIKTQKEKKELQKKLIQAQKMEAVGQLAGGIAHDFNNILSSILGFTELALTEVELGTTIEKDLQEVYTAGQRAKDLVKQILSFARQSDNILKPIRVDIIVKEVLNFIRASIPASIEIKSILSSHSLVLGDSTQIYQVLMNLCTNAAQAMENNGGKLTIDLQDVTIKNNSSVTEFSLKPGNYIKLRVADTGMGITSNIIESIFEPYFTTKSAGMGTGMGLAVVHRIIEDHKGKIIVTSETEKGSVFTIWLPISEKQPSRQIYKSEELPTGTEHLLFVDDEVPIVKVFTRILENLGYSITGTTSSTEALGLFRARPDNFDLVITDMTMPDMNGDALAKKIISLRPDIPIILCTGYSKMISRSTAFEIGIKALVHKPIVRADLAKAIRKAIDQAQDSF